MRKRGLEKKWESFPLSINVKANSTKYRVRRYHISKNGLAYDTIFMDAEKHVWMLKKEIECKRWV